MLGLGLDLALKPSVGVAGFSPLALAPSAWYDPSDLSTLWQDTAGTSPVTADGQAVARMDDKSGNGNHLLQATAANRPLYKTLGGLKWLEFDGINDWLSDAFTVTHPADRVSAIRALSWTANDTFFGDTTSKMMMGQAGASPSVFLTTTANDPGVSMTLNTDFVVTERWTAAGPSTSLQLNNAAAVTGNPGTGAPAGLVVGDRFGDGGFPANFRLYGVFQKSGTLSAGDLASLKTWIGAKAGVTV